MALESDRTGAQRLLEQALGSSRAQLSPQTSASLTHASPSRWRLSPFGSPVASEESGPRRLRRVVPMAAIAEHQVPTVVCALVEAFQQTSSQLGQALAELRELRGTEADARAEAGGLQSALESTEQREASKARFLEGETLQLQRDLNEALVLVEKQNSLIVSLEAKLEDMRAEANQRAAVADVLEQKGLAARAILRDVLQETVDLVEAGSGDSLFRDVSMAARLPGIARSQGHEEEEEEVLPTFAALLSAAANLFTALLRSLGQRSAAISTARPADVLRHAQRSVQLKILSLSVPTGAETEAKADATKTIGEDLHPSALAVSRQGLQAQQRRLAQGTATTALMAAAVAAGAGAVQQDEAVLAASASYAVEGVAGEISAGEAQPEVGAAAGRGEEEEKEAEAGAHFFGRCHVGGGESGALSLKELSVEPTTRERGTRTQVAHEKPSLRAFLEAQGPPPPRRRSSVISQKADPSVSPGLRKQLQDARRMNQNAYR
jgi:hypothetical protein